MNHIGKNSKTYSVPDDLVIDGQQRLTALLAAILGIQIKDKNYNERFIKISFNPLKDDFQVWSQAYERDPVQTATFRGQQGRISRSVRAILNGQPGISAGQRVLCPTDQYCSLFQMKAMLSQSVQ